MKALLTGGTGFLGKRVARALVDKGHELRLLVRGYSNLDGLPRDVSFVRGDVTDAAVLAQAAEGCDAVLHMAALVKTWVPDRERFDEVNVGGIRNALAAARAVGARLVYTSSFMALGPSSSGPADERQIHAPDRYCNDYERTKAQADEVARDAAACGQDVVMLYPGVLYGPGDLTDGNIVVKMVIDHLRGKLPGIVGPGDRLWSYSFVDDVAGAHVAALERGRSGERYCLSGENATLTQVFATVAELTGVQPPTRHIPYALARALGYALYLWAELTGYPPLLTHEVASVFRQHWAYTSAKAERELDYRPRSLRVGLESTVAWLKDRGVC